MATIPLNNGRTATIDDDDLERVWRHRWWLNPQNGYAYTEIKGTKITLHRFVMNAKPGEWIDHKHEPKSNCRKTNLRVATIQQNAANRRKTTKGKFKGVYRSASGRWRACITFNRKTYDLVVSSDPEECAVYYDVAAQLCFGEFARINGV